MYLYISMSKNIWLSRQFNQMYFNSIYMLLGHIYQVELIQIQTILKGYLRVGKRRKVNLVWVLFIFHHFFPFFLIPCNWNGPGKRPHSHPQSSQYADSHRSAAHHSTPCKLLTVHLASHRQTLFLNYNSKRDVFNSNHPPLLNSQDISLSKQYLKVCLMNNKMRYRDYWKITLISYVLVQLWQ